MNIAHAEGFKRHIWALPFEVVMTLSFVVFIWTGQYGHAATTLFLLIASLALPLIEYVCRVRLSPILHALYVGFLFISMFAGEVLGMYGAVLLWDDGLHLISGFVVGLGAVVWLTTMTNRHLFKAPAWLQVLIVIALGNLIAVVWELIEFMSDQWLGTFMQRRDLFDTMTDLAYGMVGTLIIAALFSRYLAQRRSFGVGRILARQHQLND